LIEAAMIAKNIAPGLNRHFAFQKFKDYKAKDFEKIISDAKAKIFTKKEYHLFGMDKDPELVEIAKANAKAAHVDQLIEFKTQDFLK
jgi:putative N6-adenine-specific DNA methylase